MKLLKMLFAGWAARKIFGGCLSIIVIIVIIIFILRQMNQ
jgi:hypothetical protein